jgi:hypothetical protein
MSGNGRAISGGTGNNGKIVLARSKIIMFKIIIYININIMIKRVCKKYE